MTLRQSHFIIDGQAVVPEHDGVWDDLTQRI